MKKHVLIIDDDSRNIFALSATLRAKGITCASCRSAREALELLATGAVFDALLLDMMMPDMDGYEAIPLIRTLTSRADTPIFAVTARAMAGDRERCLRAGATDYVAKPIDVDRLLQLLATV